MLAESGEERGAMMGVSWECCHQLTCVLTDLREWIEGWLLFFGLTATVPTQLMLVCCCEQLSARTPVLPPPHTTAHTTPNTHQVREQTTEHAMRGSSLGVTFELTSPERWGRLIAVPAPPLLRRTALEAQHTKRQHAAHTSCSSARAHPCVFPLCALLP